MGIIVNSMGGVEYSVIGKAMDKVGNTKVNGVGNQVLGNCH